MLQYLITGTVLFQAAGLFVGAQSAVMGGIVFIASTALQAFLIHSHRAQVTEIDLIKKDMEAIKSALSGVMIQANRGGGY